MYRHTQKGTAILAGLAAGAATLLLGPALIPSWRARTTGRLATLPALGILAASAALLGTLTTAVRDGRLEWSFGPGLIRKSVRVADIENAEPTRTSFLEGWGIHWTPRGWLYNVSGTEAVWVQMKRGRRFLLGTDEPERLILAIRAGKGGRPE